MHCTESVGVCAGRECVGAHLARVLKSECMKRRKAVKAETRSPESFLRVWLRDGGPSVARGHNSERIILEGHLR